MANGSVNMDDISVNTISTNLLLSPYTASRRVATKLHPEKRHFIDDNNSSAVTSSKLQGAAASLK
jgi:hypothetical protein